MSKLVRSHQPCPDCGSKDALAEYDDGHTYCFSCCKIRNPDGGFDEEGYGYDYVPLRGISREVFEFYGAKAKYNQEGEVVSVGFPYTDTTLKARRFDVPKDSPQAFRWVIDGENNASLFGMDRFSSGSSKSITITEGEFDALAAYEMLNRRHPVVSVRSASTAKRDCTTALDYLNSFDRVYLCFDNDPAGLKAVKEVASLFDFNKVYHVKLTKYKDANDYLAKGSADEFRNVWNNARRFIPEGILSSHTEIEQILQEGEKKARATYPWPSLQSISYGLRTGEIVLIKALEGIGKTEFIRSIEYHILQTTEDKIGVIHLEESKSRFVKGIAGLHLKQPCHLPDSQVPLEQVLQAYKEAVKEDERVHIYSHFGSEDPDVILSTIRFLVSACGCKFIFLDHISQVVSGLDTDNERQAIDKIMTKLSFMVEELDFCLVLISHVNDQGLTRSSRYISKVASLVIDLYRNKTAETEEERNTTVMTVEKNRFSGRTGPAGKLLFDFDTFMMVDSEDQASRRPVERLPPVSATHTPGF